MVGLVDFDLQSNTSSAVLPPPNLEIMKLATYYRMEENKFCRLVALDEQELSQYEKIYFFSEKEYYPEVPDAFRRATNIIYGGAAFTQNVYTPFENSVIDFTIPRPSIYSEFLKQKYDEGIKAKRINHVLDDSYYRMYAGAQRLPIPPIIPKKRVFLYDTEFFYDDWKQIINHIIDRKPSGIYRIHPIRCKTITQYNEVRSISKLARINDIILDFNVPEDEIYYLLKRYKNMFLADITANSNVFIPLSGSFRYEQEYRNDLIYKLNLLYSFWSCGIMIKIRYQRPQVGFYDPMPNLHKVIETWANHITKNKKSLRERVPKPKRKDEIPPIQLELDRILQFEPRSKTLFDQTLSTIKKGGLWRI